MDNPKFEAQNNQYEFPYHYLAYLDKDTPQIKRTLDWGIEYLTYMKVVIDEIHSLKYNNILDIGCGDGYLLNNLETTASKLGIDLSEKAIMFANAFAKDARFEIKDLFTIDNQYDLISLIEVLEHIPNDFVDSFMQKVLSLVKKNGHFVISVPTTAMPLGNKHYRHYDEKLLDQHIDVNKHGIELIKEIRVFNMTSKLRFCLRMINNKVWTINHKGMLKKFWNWHMNTNKLASEDDGFHLIRVYKKTI